MTLRVTIEIVPLGSELDKYTIGELNISNVKQFGLGLCSYSGDYATLTPENNVVDIVRFTEVKHKRQEGPLVLIKKVIRSLTETPEED